MSPIARTCMPLVRLLARGDLTQAEREDIAAAIERNLAALEMANDKAIADAFLDYANKPRRHNADVGIRGPI